MLINMQFVSTLLGIEECKRIDLHESKDFAYFRIKVKDDEQALIKVISKDNKLLIKVLKPA